MKEKRFERGQSLVIIVLAIVAIFGFAALAVDVGRIFAERRRAQSAADSAALAAAYAAANAPIEAKHADLLVLEEQTAKASVMENGFSNDQVTVEPPTDGEYEECDCEYIQVSITSKVDPIFSQFVFKGIEEITTVAVARGRRNPNLSEYNAIHALSTDTNALLMEGTTTVNLTGGNIFSNGGGYKDGASGKIKVRQGNIRIAKDNGWKCNGCNANTVSPAPQYRTSKGVDYQPENVLDVPAPYCPAKTATMETDSNGLNYYVHNGISGTMILDPGIHCVYGDIVLNGNDKLSGKDVLIVMKEGGIKINGNAKLSLLRASAIKDKQNHSYNGMLIYIPRDNTSTIMLGGTADSVFTGTVFGSKATCDVGGTSETYALHTSIICDKIKFHGTSDVQITYKQEENFQMQPLVELIK